MTYRKLTASVITHGAPESVVDDVAAKFAVPADSPPLRWLEWLGFFSDERPPLEKGSPLDVLVARMVEKMSYGKGERDMLVMHHEFIAEYPANGKSEKITSTLLDFGIPGGDSSMARTVSLPAAMAARLILEGKIKGTGVQIPVSPAVYEPLLKELAEMENGIHFKETRTNPALPLAPGIKLG